MNAMEAVDDCNVADMDRHPNENVIMTKPFLSVESLYVGAFACLCMCL